MDFWDVIDGRHSTRAYSEEAVPREKLARVLHAAAAAPSAMNSQPWRYHVAEGEARGEVGKLLAQATVHLTEYIEVLGQERYEEAVEWYSSLGNAPVVIGVSATTSETEFDVTNTLLSVGASIQNLLLAATAEGLGACNITFAWWVREELAARFGVSEDRQVVAIIALGYPGTVAPASPPHREDVADWVG
jgi:nitroreductase